MEKIEKEKKALKQFEKIIDDSYNSGKKGRELMIDATKDKDLLEIVGTLEYIPNLADDDEAKCEAYFNSLTEEQKEVVKMYYNLYKKMELYSNGEGGESKRDHKFYKFVSKKFN